MEPLLPKVGVAPQREYRGMETFTPPKVSDNRGPVRALECVPFEHVFFPFDQVQGATPWRTDAHFLCYRVVDPNDPTNTQAWPRCNATILPELRARGCDIHMTMLVFDFDNIGKRRWQEGEVQKFCEFLVEQAKAGHWLLMSWTCFYTTKHGARFVYVLRDEIRADAAKAYLLGIMRDFRSAGVQLDASCKDWQRLFRAPYVVRRMEAGKKGTPNYACWNENSWEDPHFMLFLQQSNRLDVRFITPADVHDDGPSVLPEHIDTAQPDQSCLHLLEETNPGTGRRIQSQWYKSAKHLLTGRACFDCIFNNMPIASEGGRDNTIHQYVGQACSMLGTLEGTDAELIYALFLPAVLKLEADAQTSDWTAVLWRAVLQYWGKELARKKDAEAEIELVAEQQKSLGQHVLHGMRQWCDDDRLKTTDETAALAFASEHLIACCQPSSYFIMSPDGHYDSMPVRKEHIIARIRALGMEAIIPLRQARQDGMGFRALNIQELINNHGTLCARVEGVAGGPGTLIRNLGRDDATFVLRMYWRRTDLDPVWNKDVDQWLRLLFGKEYERGVEWLSHALALEDGPTCALSIMGAPGSGKMMLASGLAECWNTEAVAGAEEFGKYQSGLLSTPIVNVNEGFQEDPMRAKNIADVFRSLVSGDPVRIEEKYRPIITIRVPVRVLITANDDHVVTTLTGHKDLGEYGREALAIRLLHIRTSHDAAHWLKGMGGLGFTSQAGRRWVRGTDGTSSNYVLARHFMYLYQNRRPVLRGQRLLVEGGLGSDVANIIRTQSGFAPEIIEALIQLIECDNANMFDGICISDTSKVFVTIGQVLKFHRAVRTSLSGKSVNERVVESVLNSLVVSGNIRLPRSMLNRRGAVVEAVWFELDLGVLYSQAMRNGYPSTKLAALIRRQVGLPELTRINAPAVRVNGDGSLPFGNN